MATIGTMNKRATFRRDTGTVGVGGSRTRHWSDLPGLVKVPVEYKPERGRDRVQAGRLEASAVGVFMVQGCAAIRDLTTADIIVIHEQSGDVPHRIVSIENPDQRGRDYEILAEKGVQLG
jgi:head-tail adaptor